MYSFDLIEFQEEARTIKSPKRLFELWEKVCVLYDKGLIGKYELEEMKETIWPHMQALTRLKLAVDSSMRKKSNLTSIENEQLTQRKAC